MNGKMYEMIALKESKRELTEIVNLNELSSQFGLRLTETDAITLAEGRKEILHENSRIEFGESILKKMIFLFCDSPYIYQDNYAETLGELQRIFYFYKNETMDVLTDEELLEFMEKHFNGDCQGSLDYLEETCMELMARDVRAGRNIEKLLREE